MKTFDNGNLYSPATTNRHTPVLNGDVFCSPACGFNCKKIDFDRATELAQALALQLGRGWKTHVWENAGWHFEVSKGIATVSFLDGQYVGVLDFTMSETNRVWIQRNGTDPRNVVEAISHELNEKITLLKRALLSLSLDHIEIENDYTV